MRIMADKDAYEADLGLWVVLTRPKGSVVWPLCSVMLLLLFSLRDDVLCSCSLAFYLLEFNGMML